MLGKLLWLTRFGGLLLLLIFFPMWIVWMGWSSWELSRAKSTLAESGMPRDIEEIIRPKVEEGKNAFSPLLSADKILESLTKKSPSPVSLNLHKKNRNLTAEDFAIAASELATPELAQVMEYAKQATFCSSYCPARDYRKGPMVPLGPASGTLQISKLLALQAILNARAHDQEKSVEDILAISRLARLMRSDNLVISVLVGISADSISVLTAQQSIEALGDVPFSPSTWAALSESWEKNDRMSRSSMANAVATETCTSGWFMFERPPGVSENPKSAETGERDPRTLVGNNQENRPTPPISRGIYGGVMRPMLKMDHAVYLRSMVNIHERIKSEEGQKSTHPSKSEEIPRWAIVSNLLVSGMESLPLRVTTDEVFLRLGRVGLALESYRSEKGTYPASLSELGLPPNVTSDPFSDRDMVYKPSGNSVLVYSLGVNRSDEGGLTTGHSKDGDMVWQIRRK